MIRDDLDLQAGFVIRLNGEDGVVREMVVGDDPWEELRNLPPQMQQVVLIRSQVWNGATSLT